jgi:hypothetical protein
MNMTSANKHLRKFYYKKEIEKGYEKKTTENWC